MPRHDVRSAYFGSPARPVADEPGENTGSWLGLAVAVVTEICWALRLIGDDARLVAGVGGADRPQARQHGPARAGNAGLPAGTAHAVWTGLGAVGVIIGDAVFFRDRVGGVQAGFMALTVIGVVGTKLFAQGLFRVRGVSLSLAGAVSPP